MFFGERILSQDRNYTSLELLEFVQLLLRESTSKEIRLHSKNSNYGWLRSRPIEVDVDLEQYKTMVLKLSSASCAAIAVSLDSLTEEEHSTKDILTMFENLINEQQTINIIENNIKNGKNKKKLYPELLLGRKPSVSFVMN